jgi:endonuclease YncB( thermonuclease family)
MRGDGRMLRRRLRITSASAILIASFVVIAASPKAQAACDLELQGEGRVSAIVDARTLRLDDGRDIRLAGIESAGQDESAAIASLRAVAQGREVTLHGTNDTPDRYGRQRAFVFVYGAETSLQDRLLREGQARVAGTVMDQTCAMELLKAEGLARSAKRGIWASSAAIKNAERPADILAEVGRFAIVEGKVRSVRQAGTIWYVNFGRYRIAGFAATISRRMMPAIEAQGLSLTSLTGQRVRIRGWVTRRGGPRIDVVHPGQIEPIDDNRAATAARDK